MVRSPRFLATIILLSGAIVPFGCGKADVKDYVPADELARTSLTAALDAWQSGKPLDAIGATAPAINAQDTLWAEGKKLEKYEIVGSEKSEEQKPQFRVRLWLAGEATPREVVYVVVGKDPIWVFSEASYNRASGM